MNSNKSVSDQVKEINKLTQNNIEWKFDGNKIVPKSLNVARLHKSLFSKSLKINRIRRKIFVSEFKKTYTIDGSIGKVQLKRVLISNHYSCHFGKQQH
jgi:hypothetical protein